MFKKIIVLTLLFIPIYGNFSVKYPNQHVITKLGLKKDRTFSENDALRNELVRATIWFQKLMYKIHKERIVLKKHQVEYLHIFLATVRGLMEELQEGLK